MKLGTKLIATAVIATLVIPPPIGYGQAEEDAMPLMMTAEIKKSIDRGLNYLAKTQRPNGSWSNSGGYGSYPTSMTALAGLALLASGSTPREGPYAKNIRNAMKYLMGCAKAHNDGLIAGGGNEYQSMYGHGFGMLFLAQCYGMETSPETQQELYDILKKAVDVTAGCQSKINAEGNPGGWIYTPNGGGDEGSVTVTQLQALRACRNVGIPVPKETIDRAVAYLKYCQNPDGGICYSASSRGGSTIAISAAGIACFYSAGVYDKAHGASGKEAEMVEKLVSYCRQNVRVGQNYGGHYYYTHLYYGQVMYQRGGKDWKEYFPTMSKWLMDNQSTDGSWNGDSVGTTYGTAIALVILQQPYGFLPIYQR